MTARRRHTGAGSPTPVSFDEFKLYYESAEKVTERRLSTNRWNYSVCTAILLAVGGVLSWSTSRDSFRFIGAIGSLFLAGMAVFFCNYWISQIDDFKALNTAKFGLLNKMAPHVIFDGSGTTSAARSFEPFQKEWKDLEAARALQPKRGPMQRALALKSTRQEYFLPKAFRVLFVITFVTILAFAVVSRDAILDHVSPFYSTTHIQVKGTHSPPKVK